VPVVVTPGFNRPKILDDVIQRISRPGFDRERQSRCPAGQKTERRRRDADHVVLDGR